MTNRLPADAFGPEQSDAPSAHIVQFTVDESAVRLLGVLAMAGLSVAGSHRYLRDPARLREVEQTARHAWNVLRRRSARQIEDAIVPMFVAMDAPPELLAGLREAAAFVSRLNPDGTHPDEPPPR